MNISIFLKVVYKVDTLSQSSHLCYLLWTCLFQFLFLCMLIVKEGNSLCKLKFSGVGYLKCLIVKHFKDFTMRFVFPLPLFWWCGFAELCMQLLQKTVKYWLGCMKSAFTSFQSFAAYFPDTSFPAFCCSPRRLRGVKGQAHPWFTISDNFRTDWVV